MIDDDPAFAEPARQVASAITKNWPAPQRIEVAVAIVAEVVRLLSGRHPPNR